MKNFEGKTAVITGAASGIGKALAEKFAQEKMQVVLADIEEEALEKVHEFNQTGALGFIPAFKDSVEYVTRLAREGWRFDVVTMIGKDKYAHRLRKINLQHLFGDVFDEEILIYGCFEIVGGSCCS